MNCDGVRGLLSAYVDGELSPGELLRVEQHLRRCHCCADEVDSLRQTIALVASMDEVAIPVTFYAQLHDRLIALGPPVPAVRRIPAAPSWQRNVRRWAVPAAAAAAAALAIGLTSLPQARELARGLEGVPVKFSVEGRPQVATNEPGPPKQQDGQPSVPPPTGAESGKPGNNDPVPPKDVPVQSDGTNSSGPAPDPGTNAAIAPGEAGPNVGGTKVATDPPVVQPPAQLKPQWTYREDATVATANPENLTKALAAFNPTLEADTLYIIVPAAQRTAVEDAVRKATGATVIGGFAATQTNNAGQIHDLEGHVAFYRQQLDLLEKQIPKLKGTEQEDALAQHKAYTEKLENDSATLSLVKGQVDKAIITVHLKVQGR